MTRGSSRARDKHDGKKIFRGARAFVGEYDARVNGLPETPPELCTFVEVPHVGPGGGFDPTCGGGCPFGTECGKINTFCSTDPEGDLVISFGCDCIIKV